MKTFVALGLCLTASAYGGTCSYSGGTLVVPPTQDSATAESLAVNGDRFAPLRDLARSKACTTGQLALAWLLARVHQGHPWLADL